MGGVGSDFLTVVTTRTYIHLDVMPCSPLKDKGRFGTTYRLHLDAPLAAFFMLESCLAYSLMVNMKTKCSS
jgi:hypothetical protein